MADIPRWRRIIRAAGRLAALYVGTTLILLVTVASMQGFAPTLSDLNELWIPFGIVFVFAFFLLASARRAGLVALWVILSGLWLFLWKDAPFGGVSQIFIVWTVFALPLYGLGMIGAPNRIRLLRWTSLAVAIIWCCGLAAAFVVAGRRGAEPSGLVGLLFRTGHLLWTPFPFALCVHEIVRVWNATRDLTATTSGAPE